MATAKGTKHALVPEVKSVRNKKTGKAHLQKYLVIAGKQTAIPAKRGTDLYPLKTEVRFLPKGGKSYIKAYITKVHPKSQSYTVETAKLESGKTATYKVSHADIISHHDWTKYRYVAPKSATKTATDQGNHVLNETEIKRRRTTMKKRLGSLNENAIVTHPSFLGPAMKITTDLAHKNNIPVRFEDGKYTLYNAEDFHHQELIFRYVEAAIKAARRELARGGTMDAQTKRNVQEFRDVLAGKKKWSYVHDLMRTEGRGAAIKYLKELQEEGRRDIGMDYESAIEDDRARRLVDKHGKPQQFPYTLARNKETLQDDISAIVRTFTPDERTVVMAKHGFKPFSGEKGFDEIADHLNARGSKYAGTYRWNRNSVSEVYAGAIDKLKMASADTETIASRYTNEEGKRLPLKYWSPEDQAAYAAAERREGLQYHRDVHLGRADYETGEPVGSKVHVGTEPEASGPVKRFTKKEIAKVKHLYKSLPAEYHPAGDFTANGITYTVEHRDGQAVIVTATEGGVELSKSFDVLFDALEKAQESADLKAVSAIEQEFAKSRQDDTALAGLIAKVFATRNLLHFSHWMTGSYAAHMAMGDLYDEVIDAIDDVVECYQGAFGKLSPEALTTSQTSFPLADAGIIERVKGDMAWVAANREAVTHGDSSLSNLVDVLIGAMQKATYKLENLG